MDVASVADVTAESEQSLQDALRAGLGQAAQAFATVHDSWVEEQQVIVCKGRPSTFRVDLRVTFRPQ